MISGHAPLGFRIAASPANRRQHPAMSHDTMPQPGSPQSPFTLRLRMAIKRSQAVQGTLVVLEHHSKVLRDNPLGDPYQRKLGIWFPPAYDDGTHHRKSGKGRAFPVLYDLVGFTGSGLAH